MNALEYRATLSRLSLTQDQAARFLGVSLRTANRYAKLGPEGPAARALTMLQAMPEADRAALMAMREPSEAMCLAACETEGVADRWTAMIDAILNEGVES